MSKVLVAAIVGVLGGSASMANDVWPELPRSGFIVGRPAVPKDVERGNAVFATKSGGSSTGKLAPIDIPQFGYLTNESGVRLPVVIVQAETNEQGTYIGMRDVSGQEYVATRAEVTLLGKVRPR